MRNSAGKVIIPCEYDEIEGDFSTGNAGGTKISPDQTSISYYILSKSGVAARVDADSVFSCTETGRELQERFVFTRTQFDRLCRCCLLNMMVLES
jgi:hypothetical protein